MKLVNDCLGIYCAVAPLYKKLTETESDDEVDF